MNFILFLIFTTHFVEPPSLVKTHKLTPPNHIQHAVVDNGILYALYWANSISCAFTTSLLKAPFEGIRFKSFIARGIDIDGGTCRYFVPQESHWRTHLC